MKFKTTAIAKPFGPSCHPGAAIGDDRLHGVIDDPADDHHDATAMGANRPIGYESPVASDDLS